MRLQKRPIITIREFILLAGLGLAAMSIIGLLLFADIRLSKAINGGKVFIGIWAGTRDLIFKQANPYGAAIAEATRYLVDKSLPTIGHNLIQFNLPFFLAPFFFPFAFLPDVSIARGIWICLSQITLATSLVISLKIVEWRPPGFLFAMLALLAEFSLYSAAAVLDGTPVVMLAAFYPAILLVYRDQHDELTGLLIALSLFAWEAGTLFLLLVFWRVIHERRWRVLAGFGMGLTIMLAASFLLYPGWILPFITATTGALRDSAGTSMTALILRLFPSSGARIAQGAMVLMWGMIIVEWAAAQKSGFRHYIWLCCLGLAAAPLLGPRIEISNMVVLLPSAVLICAAGLQRSRTGYLFALIYIGIVMFVPWFLFGHWYLQHYQKSQDYLFLLYPLLSIVGLYWIRWWYLYPQRTWFDQVRPTKDRQ